MTLRISPFVAFTALVQLALIKLAFCQDGPYPADDSDLASFISRPDLKPPLFNVTNLSPSRVNPGFWFLAPYSTMLSSASRNFEPAQVGPVIYDDQGTLIWCGASTFHPRAIVDFRVASYNGRPHLSLVVYKSHSLPEYPKGAGLILDNSYAIRAEIHGDGQNGSINLHEFNVINQGESVLLTRTGLNRNGKNQVGRGQDIGFREVEITSGKIVFDWYAWDHVELWESTVSEAMASADYFHINSVDKNSEGDYLISARHANCIYKVSGIDGSIIWRLGGKRSSFVMDGFNFSSQHDARFREENSTTTVISFLNNASDGKNSTANYSSAVFVALHTSKLPMTASLIARYDRPDQQLTELRGNVQVMPNRNIVACWSENGHVSEFTPEGEHVLEASFTSMRFATYRAYKFNFTAFPTEPPTLKANAFGLPPGPIYTIYYVSWNGATEVAFWNFYGSKDRAAKMVLVGKVAKSGFETMFTFAGYFPWALAEAVAADGRILGTSILVNTIVPPGLNFAQDAEDGDNTSTDDNRPLVGTWVANPGELIWKHWVTILVIIIASLLTALVLFFVTYNKPPTAASLYASI